MASKNNQRSQPSDQPPVKTHKSKTKKIAKPAMRRKRSPIEDIPASAGNLKVTENVRRERDLFYTLFHSNPLPTALTRMEDAQFIDANEAYLNYFELDRETVIHHFANELNLPIDPRLRPRLVAQLQKEGALHDIELHIARPLGDMRIILLSLQLVKIDATSTIIQTFTDITDRVHAEQQVRSLAIQLTGAEQEERRRISQLLHDDLQQRIFAVKMQVATLYDAYQKGNLESAHLDFTHLQEELDEAISITRNLSIDLSPAILRGDGLTDALVWLCSQMENKYGLKVTMHSNGIAARFEDSLRVLIFQAVREILFNVVKHANTLEATITMETADDCTRITISDGGMGFDAQAVLEGSKTAGGLQNLQHRLNLVGCNLEIRSKPNVKGTQVIIEIPLEK
jgi:signal transduction histidine kinase